MRAVTVTEYGGTPAVAEIRRGAGSPVCSDQMALYREVLPVRTPFREVPGACRILMAAAFMLGAIARDTSGDPDAAGRALQRGLDLTGPDQVLPLFLIHRPPGLLDRPARHHSADAALSWQAAHVPAQMDRLAPPPGQPARHVEAPSRGEVRVLRYLPTNLSAREIAGSCPSR